MCADAKCKSTNILITRGHVAKVGDFGLARVKHTTRSMIASLVGTVNWQAPELWHANPRYDYKVDVFSAALVFWEMLSGWAPAGEKVSNNSTKFVLTAEIPVGGPQRALHLRGSRAEAQAAVARRPAQALGPRANQPRRADVGAGSA